MIKKLLMLLLVHCLSNAYAHPCHLTSGKNRTTFPFNGQTQCEKGKVGLLEVNGELKINQTEVSDALLASGHTVLEHANIHIASLIGFVDASDTIFSGPLELDGEKAILTNCITRDIVISAANLKKSKLTLKGTRVNGSIEFMHKNGIVELRDGAMVTGQITGAIAIHKGKTAQ